MWCGVTGVGGRIKIEAALASRFCFLGAGLEGFSKPLSSARIAHEMKCLDALVVPVNFGLLLLSRRSTLVE